MNENELLPWTEKYRPKKLADIAGQEEIVKTLGSFVKAKNMPNMLFAGPAGVGKTTASIALAHEIYGGNMPGNFLELNASVTADTPIMIKRNGKIKRTTFGWLAETYFKGDEKRVGVDDLEILSIDKEYKVRFSKIGYLFRHKVDRIAEIRYEGGLIRTSLDHSVIIFNEDGELVSKTAAEIAKGDHLITFKTEMKGDVDKIDLAGYKPNGLCRLRSGVHRNPKIRKVFGEVEANNDLIWSLGLYLAEGCTSFSRGTSGQVVYALGYPNEKDAAHLKRLENAVRELDLAYTKNLASSGFDRSVQSSIQLRFCNTQIASFLDDNFYDGGDVHNARTKRVPPFVFQLQPDARREFLKRYWDGDGTGQWEGVARICSVSQDYLIDVAWLGRMTSKETSVFRREARLINENEKFSYVKSELLPSAIFRKLARKYGGKLNYLLRHSMYSKKSGRISKKVARHVLKLLKGKPEEDRLRRLVDSDIYAVNVEEVKIKDFDDYVYDVSVPGCEMFWGGTTPVLLHNSDERGIDVVRGKIKDFARSVSLGKVDFKLIFLDEADALTPDAQHALRRTMEVYSSITRFILSCNYSSRIIEPIQSRTAIFRFLRLNEKDVKKTIEAIAKNEGLKIDDDVISALFYISEGDMRKCINILQGAAMHGKHITRELVYRISSRAEPKEIREMMELSLAGKFLDARKKLDSLILNYGLSGEDILLQMYREVDGLEVDERKKVALVDRIGEYNFRLVEGANERIQIEALLAQIMLLGK